jgi:hypothetical protein
VIAHRALVPGRTFALACFAAGEMGSEDSDDSFYKAGTLAGGLAYSDSELRELFRDFKEVEIRRMRSIPEGAEVFGQDFLTVALFRRPRK